MGAAADVIEGEHDFKCFEATGSVIKNTVRTVYGIDISVNPIDSVSGVLKANADAEKDWSDSGKIFGCTVDISVTGNGFLYNMVRIIAGTLVYVGMGKLSAKDVKRTISSGDRTLAGKTLPAKGLCLISVKYD